MTRRSRLIQAVAAGADAQRLLDTMRRAMGKSPDWFEARGDGYFLLKDDTKDS